MRRFIVFGLFVAVCASIIFLSQKFSHEPASSVLVVGVVPDYPPFYFVDQSRDVVGFDVDVVNGLSKSMGVKPRFVEMPLAALVLALSKGKIDAIVTGFESTDERKNRMRMIEYFSGQDKFIPIMFWKADPSKISRIEDLKNQKLPIAVEAGSAQQEMCKSLGVTNTREFSSYLDIIMELKRGSCVAAACDPNVVGHYMEKNPDLKISKVPLEGKFEFPPIAIGVRKDISKTADEIEKGIKEMRQAGVIEQYAEKWKMNL